MDTHIKKINRDLIIGWITIVVVFLAVYTVGVFLSIRTWQYLVAYFLVAGISALCTLCRYLKKPEDYKLRYFVICGYLLMYLFSTFTGNTNMVFGYILPLLSLLVLYHQPRMILGTGAVTFLIDILQIVVRISIYGMVLGDIWECCIQMALIIFCFAGSYVVTRLYDEIDQENIQYTKMLDDKNQQIQLMTLQTVTTIVNTIDAKDEYTKGHSRRVSEYSVALARELGLAEEYISEIRIAALLHDIGKIGVPDSVLNKPDKLTVTEYELMKQHTTIGAEILKDIQMIPGIDVGAKYHHERYDGTGYPSGLKGKEIPFLARIIAVADTYDAMTSTRIYRRHLDREKVIQEIRDGIGKQFDPEVGEALVRLLEENRMGVIRPDKDVLDNTEIRKILNRFLEEQRGLVPENPALDDLTGVYNRSHGEKLLRAAVEQRSGVLCIFDLDHFRMVNETAGYVMGDIYLKVVADTIRAISEDGIIARFSGAEFVVFMKNIVTREAAEEYMSRFQGMIAEKKTMDETLGKLSVSMGAVILDGGPKQPFWQLFRRADKALYYAKQQGGGTYSFHEDDDENPSEHQLQEVDLKQLVHNIRHKDFYQGGFQVAYPEFGHMYEYVKKVVERNNQQVQILLFTITANSGYRVSVEDRDRVMQYLERAIVDSIRSVDVTTRYSSTQRIVLLMALNEEQTNIVTERIMREFYKMYDRNEILVRCNTADLSKLEQEDET
ncbi:MAG: HD domain-containing phosphohydrolase [Roseburia sp.]